MGKKDAIVIREIRTVGDLMKATVKDGATISNGGYDLFFDELKKYIICDGNKLMLWEDWYKKPHPLISNIVDVDFEIIQTKQIENGKKKLP